MTVPSLQDICLRQMSSMLHKQIPSYYGKYSSYEITKEGFQRKSSFWETIKRLFEKKTLPPEDYVALSLPPRIYLDSTKISPWLLSACDKYHPMVKTDLIWSSLYTSRWPTARPPVLSSYKEAYLIKHLHEAYNFSLIDSIQSAIADIEQPAHRMAALLAIVLSLDGTLAKEVSSSVCIDIELFVKNAAFIKCLELHDNLYLSNEILSLICDEVKGLEKIDLSDGHGLTEDGLIRCIRKSPRLTHCSLGIPLNVKILHELTNCKALNYIRLTKTAEDVTFDQLSTFILSLPSLQKISLKDSKGISDEGLADLISSSKSIQHLEIFLSKSITPRFIEMLLSRRSIEHVSFIGCRHIPGHYIPDITLPYKVDKLAIHPTN